MAQYEVVKAVFEADRPLSRQEIIQKVDLHKSSIGAGIKETLDHGYIVRTEEGYETAPDFDQEQLESIRPRSIEELNDA
jgi:predicted transcriptional regulator